MASEGDNSRGGGGGGGALYGAALGSVCPRSQRFSRLKNYKNYTKKRLPHKRPTCRPLLNMHAYIYVVRITAIAIVEILYLRYAIQLAIWQLTL